MSPRRSAFTPPDPADYRACRTPDPNLLHWRQRAHCSTASSRSGYKAEELVYKGSLCRHVPLGTARTCPLASIIASAGIDGEMQLAPGPRRSTVLLLIPLALAEEFQAGAVDHQVPRVVRNDLRSAPSEAAAAVARIIDPPFFRRPLLHGAVPRRTPG